MRYKISLIVAVIGMAFRFPLFAQTGSNLQGFAVSPLQITLKGNPGSTVEGRLTLATQNTTSPTRYRLEVQDLDQTQSGGRTSIDVGQGVRSCARWISFPESIEAAPNGRSIIPVTATFPSGASGVYYAILKVRLIPDVPEEQMIVMVQPSIAVEIEAMVPGPAPLEMKVQDLLITRDRSFIHPSIVFKAVNTGVWKTSVEGDVLLYGPTGTFPIRTTIPYGRTGNPIEIYPDAEVQFTCRMNESPLPGEYRAVVRLMLSGGQQTRSEFSVTVPEGLKKGSIVGKLARRSESDIALKVDPSLIEIRMPPGATRNVPIKIQNQDSRETRVQIRISEARMDPNGFLTYSETPSAEGGWVSVTPESLTLASRRTITVRATITVPEERSGSLALVYAIQIKATAAKDDPDWESEVEYGVLVVSVEPKATPPDLLVRSFKVIRPKEDANPTAAILEILNNGGRTARVEGEIVLERANGSKISTLNIGSNQEEVILPGKMRIFRMPIGPLDVGNFHMLAEIRTLEKEKSVASSELTFISQTKSEPAGL